MGWVINCHLLHLCLLAINLQSSSSRKVIVKDDTMNAWSHSAHQIYGTGHLWNRGHNPVATCGNGKDADLWLISNHINISFVFSNVIYVNVEAGQFTTCFDPKTSKEVPCYSNYFQVYVYRRENQPNIPKDKPAVKKFLLSYFSPVYNITNNTSPIALNKRENQTFSFLQNKSKGVTFAIRSRGACGKIYQMKMYYYYCEETSINSIKFSKTVSPASGYKEVLGNCSKNSALSKHESGPSGRCYSNGSWIISGKIRCSCIEGFELNKGRECAPCRDNHYKPNVSNSECKKCPLNNLVALNRTTCECQEGYYNLHVDPARPSACYGLLMMNDKPKISKSSRGSVNVTWNKPKSDTGLNDTVKYVVKCYSCVENVCDRPCSDEKYKPNQQHGLTQTFVVVSNLKPGTTYVFRIYPKNRLNEVVAKGKWNFTTTDYIAVKTAPDTLPSEQNLPHIIIIVGVVSGLISFLIVFLLVFILRRKRTVKKSPITAQNNGDELLSSHQKMYIDPWIYERPEDAVCEFASELDPSKIFLQMMIGGGEFGDVYRGDVKRHDGSTSPVAVKTLKCDASPKSERDFLLEASVMGQFDNPNVIQLEGVVTKKKPHMIVTEFMSNGSLDNFLKIKDGMLSQLQLIGMARGVASGMKYLARMNFVHRDLAARNVLVNDSLLCKVADFGLSRGLETSDSSRGEYSTTGGKIPVRWTAPEAIKYKKFSSTSDVWSYGILLWEIMSFAKRPYWDWDNFQVMEELDKGFRLPAPLKCPKGVHHLMLLCWKTNRGERPTFVDITRLIDGWILSPETLEDEVEFSSSLGEWLQSIKMKKYVSELSAAGYENPSQLFGLGDGDLKRMGITLVGHRNKILKSIRYLKANFSKEMFEVEDSVDV